MKWKEKVEKMPMSAAKFIHRTLLVRFKYNWFSVCEFLFVKILFDEKNWFGWFSGAVTRAHLYATYLNLDVKKNSINIYTIPSLNCPAIVFQSDLL